MNTFDCEVLGGGTSTASVCDGLGDVDDEGELKNLSDRQRGEGGGQTQGEGDVDRLKEKMMCTVLYTRQAMKKGC